MKWLVISDDAKKTALVHECLTSCGQKGAISDFYIFSTTIDKLIPFLEKSDHAIIFSKSVTEATSVISFVSGFYAGRKNMLFASGDKNAFCELGIPLNSCFDSEDELFEALKRSYTILAKAQAKREAYDYLFENGMPFTPDSFAECIMKNKFDLCQSYVTAGMSVNVRTSEGIPMLNVAARSEHIDCVKWLLELGADIDAFSDDRGYTAIMDSVWRGNKELVKLFVDKGAAVGTISKEGQTMLVLAVGAGRTDICKIIVESGESPDIPDAMGMSAYAYAKLFKKDDIVAILEKYHKVI